MPSTNANMTVVVLGCELFHFSLLSLYLFEGSSLIAKYYNPSLLTTVLAMILLIWPSVSEFLVILGHEMMHVSTVLILHLRTKVKLYHEKGSILTLIPKQLNVSRGKNLTLTLSGVCFNVVLYIVIICAFFTPLFRDLSLELTVALFYFALVNLIVIGDSLNIAAVGNDLYLLLRRFGYPANGYQKHTLLLRISSLLSYIQYAAGLSILMLFVYLTCGGLNAVVFSVIGTIVALVMVKKSIISKGSSRH